MAESDAGTSRGETIVDLIHEIRDMPEAEIFLQIESLDQSIYIFEANYQELRKLIQFYSEDRRGEHLQYLRHRDLQFQLGDEVLRLLHNYAAASLSLIEHTRNLIRHLDPDCARFPDYQGEIDRVFKADPLSLFVKDLRKFVQHYKTPGLIFHTAVVGNEMINKLGIRICELTKFDGWSSYSRRYLESIEDFVDILDTASLYHEKVGNFYDWFKVRLEEIFSEELSKYHEKHDLIFRLQLERKINSCIASPEHNVIENCEFLAGCLTTPEIRQLGAVPFRKRADLVIKFLKSRCDLSEDYELKIRRIFQRELLGKPMSERFEDFLVQYTRDARGDMVPIEYRDCSAVREKEGFTLMGKLEADPNMGRIEVFINEELLSENGLPEESVETVAAHEILHFSLQVYGFPSTKPHVKMPHDSAEVAVGSALQCLFQQVPIVRILENFGFNIREVIEVQNEMQLQALKTKFDGRPDGPGSATFAMMVLTYMEVQLIGNEYYKKSFRDLITEKNSLVVKHGDQILVNAVAVNLLTPEGQLFAIRETIKTLGLDKYVVAVDGRIKQRNHVDTL